MLKFDENGFCIEPDVATVFHFNADGEYTGSLTQRILKGTTLSPNSCLDAPPSKKEGYAIVRKDNAWSYVEDNRNKTVYSINDGRLVEIKNLGPLPDDVTTLPRPSHYYKWDATVKNWVEDLNEKEEQFQNYKISLIVALKNKADAHSNHALMEYPEVEKNSFAMQKEEAEAWMKDPNAKTPILDAIAKGRKMEKAVLVKKVLRKSAILESLSGTIAGRRQAIMDQLDVAKTEDDLKRIEEEINAWSAIDDGEE